MNKKYKDTKLRLHFVILGFIIILTFFLSIGYASFESITLDISGNVTAIPQSEIFISDVTYSTNINADTEKSIIHQYYQTVLSNTVVLGNTDNSSITYTITIYNNSDETHVFNSLEYIPEFYDNPNIVCELDGLKQGDLLPSKQQIVFSVKFHYLDNVVQNYNVLNSYLNFKFVKENKPDEIPDINNILINANKIMVYNAEKDKLLIDITNNNNIPVKFNLLIEDNIIDTISIEPEQSKSIGKDVKEILAKLQPNKEYEVIIEPIEPNWQKKETGVKFQVFPTITNYNLGLRTTGDEENPYLIYKIEDLIRFAQNVNSGNTFANIYLKQINNLDFNNASDYYNSADISFGNLNDNNDDNNQIITEMTTGSGFIMIGTDTNYFQGIYDGNNNKIDNITINNTNTLIADEMKVGLFRYINNATLKNVTIAGNYNIVKDGGGFVGGTLGNSNILNCHNNVNITNEIEGFSVGGITGILMPGSTLLIDNCTNTGNITNVNTSGGLAGLVNQSVLTVTNSSNSGRIVSTINSNYAGAGGLAGKDNSGGATIRIYDSQNSGEVVAKKAAGPYVGNMSSKGTLVTERCTNTGNIIIGTTTKCVSSDIQQEASSAMEILNVNDTVNAKDENISLNVNIDNINENEDIDTKPNIIE